MDEHRPIRLLSLDGGGIRGISSILVLKEVMRQINLDRKPEDHLQPWQVFDLIGGTSTGGIIALMLGCLQMSVDDCYNVYMKLAKTIFKPKRWKCDVFNRSIDLVSANERYDSSKMEQLVKQIIQERAGSQNAMLQDFLRESPCKVFVTTVRADDEELLLLRSYENKQQPDAHSSSFEMWEALRATSAASTYFKEYRRGNVGYVDGAFKSNNPIFEVHNEASDLWPSRDFFLVSVGTGTKPSAPLGGHVIKLVRSMTKLATATEGSWIRFHRTHKKLAEDNRLFRFSAPGIGEVDLGNHKMIGNVVMRTETYLKDTTTSKDIATCGREMLQIHTREYTTVHKLSDDERDCLRLLSGAGGAYESQRLTIERPVQGTCQWFLGHKSFINWLRDTSSALLWVTANPGCGKTVLSSFLVDVLSRQSPDATVCQFFFKAGEDDRRHSHQALCAMLHRVLKSHSQQVGVAMNAYLSSDASHFTHNIEALWEMLCQASDSLPSTQIICIVDALDECSEESRNRFIDLLVKTFPQMVGSRKLLGRLKIIATSRPWPSIENRFRYLNCVRLRGENESSSLSKDIETMVKVKVGQLKAEGIISPEACSVLETTLAKGADRTFLWASLVLEAISRLPSRKLSAVKSTLQVLPADLDQLYETALSDAKDPTASAKMLQIILAAARPLTLDEINMAMSISPTHQTVQDLLSDTEPRMEYTVKELGGFFVRVMNSTVHLVHQTAREFLLQRENTKGTTWRHCLNLSQCHSVMAQSTIAFLLLDGWPTREAAPANEVDRQASNQKLVRTFPPFARDFYQYAASCWWLHAQRQEEKLDFDLALRRKIAKLCNLSGFHFRNWWYFFATEFYFYGLDSPNEQPRETAPLGRYPLHFAAIYGCYAIMRGMIDSQSCSITWRNHRDLDCSVSASFNGQIAVVRWLLDNFECSSLQLGIALSGAVFFGRAETLINLLADHVDLQQKYRLSVKHLTMECSLLAHAVYNPEGLKLLLSRGAGDLDEAIIKAAEHAVPHALNILLSAEDNRDEEKRIQGRQAALKVASETGNAVERRILLEAGVPEPVGIDLSAGLANAVTMGCTKENMMALVQDGARDSNGQALLSRARFGDMEGVGTLFSVLEYTQEIASKALRTFFDTNLSVETQGYLLGTIKRVLSSGNRRLSNGFVMQPLIGQNQPMNEAFLMLLSSKNGRLPAARFYQALCYIIAMDEQLAVFMMKNRGTLQDEPESIGAGEYLALACLWGRKAVIEHLYETRAELDFPEHPCSLLFRAAAVSGNVEALGALLDKGPYTVAEGITPEDVGEEFAVQWSAVEEALGLSCTAISPLELGARLKYQDVMARFVAAGQKPRS